MRKFLFFILFVTAFGTALAQSKVNSVNKFIGTAGNARVSPVASVPFGMIQVAPDTHQSGSGYQYEHNSILGIVHVHKSGGGCGDFLDISFMPLKADQNIDNWSELNSDMYVSPLDHSQESAAPGYYSVALHGGDVKAELTASARSSVQRYTYSNKGNRPFVVDLVHGAKGACTIEAGKDTDTVYYSNIKQIDDYTICGSRLTNGWVTEQQVYFYTVFSSPIKEIKFYKNEKFSHSSKEAEGNDLKAIIVFNDDDDNLLVKSAISAVSCEGAKKNLLAEVKDKDFDQVHYDATQKWEKVLSKIDIKTNDKKIREIFYTSLHNVLLYPMLFSDVDGSFRGPDHKVHNFGDKSYFGAVIGVWDTFRAACPLISMLFPDIMSDYVNTFLEHFKYANQLPIWTLAGVETYQMIGLNSLPVITNAYLNGVKFDAQKALDAMVVSADTDTCGWSMGYFVGLKNYKKYGYVPCDLEMESVARTLEYAYADWAIARLAKELGNEEVYKRFYDRSKNYKNVYDASSGYMRGRKADGQWRTPFDPLKSEHRTDDYCEGNAWQWTFFVPQDVEGLAKLMGGNKALELRLDSLFTIDSKLSGENISGDISGLIGQYAHGNEPGHHTIFMYNKLNKREKSRKYATQVLETLYDNTVDGICGNEDTGQMSAWYVLAAMGMYSMDPVSGQYELTIPILDESKLNLPNGKTFIVKKRDVTKGKKGSVNIYLNGKKLARTYITFDELNVGGELIFESVI